MNESMQRKTARKEAWWPKCAAPRLVYDATLFSETFYARTRTYYNYDQIYSGKKESPLGGQVMGWTCTCVQNFREYLLETSWTLRFDAENMCILRSYLWLLGNSMFAWNVLQTCLEYLQSPRSEKMEIIPGTYVFPTETRGGYFWTLDGLRSVETRFRH